MTREIIDTNILVRFLVGDVPAQQQQAEAWLKEAEKGMRTIIVPPLVVAETCFVLETYYKKGKDEIAEALEVMLAQKWLDIPERDILAAVWPRYRAGVHFVDAYLAAWTQVRGADLLTFDKKLQREYARERE